MPRTKPFKSIILVLAVLLFKPLFAQQSQPTEEPPTTRILFLLDASKSMTGTWQGQKKYILAREVLSNILDSLKNTEHVQVGLRVYGHLKNYPPQDCNDTRLEVPFGADGVERIKNRLKYVKPRGTSPIAASLARAKTDFTSCDNCRNIVILITDGIEECGGDICEVSAELQQSGIIFKPFIVGIGQNTKESFECAGTYFNAADRDQFTNTLKVIIEKVLSRTSLQVNLLDQNNQANETNVALSFFNKDNGRLMYNFVHTMNHKGIPDTMVVDPLVSYKVVVHTKPSIIIDDIKLTEGIHNTVFAYCPQGKLSFQTSGNLPMDFRPSAIINHQGSFLNNQMINEEQKYLCGTYDVDILTLPVTHITAVEIEQNKTTKITIENPGIASIQKSVRGYGSIFVKTETGLEHIITLSENNRQSESLYLQPGEYRIVFRPRYAKQSVFTIDKAFSIQSGKTTRIKL